MNISPNQPEAHLSLEEGVHVLMNNARQCIRERHEECEDRIRKSPTNAMLGAVAVGYILHRLPLRRILVTKVRVLAALTPPALILFGAAKLFDVLQKKEWNKRE